MKKEKQDAILKRNLSYRKMLKKVAEDLSTHLAEKYNDAKILEWEIRLLTGYYVVYTNMFDKQLYVMDDSVKYINSMTNEQFKEFIVTKVTPTILMFFLPEITKEEFKKKYLSIITYE